MSEVIIEVFPAYGGDCILATFEDIGYRILIDGGFRDTFSKSLASRLQSLDADGKAIDLLVVTHVDNDHIMGIIELFRKLEDRKIKVTVREIWYNGYRHLYEGKKEGLFEEQEKRIVDEVGKMDMPEQEPQLGRDIGYAQGETLAKLLSQGWEKVWNTSFDGQAVSCHNKRDTFDLYPNYLSVMLLNPGLPELDALEYKWNLFRRKKYLSMKNGNSVIYEDCFERFLLCLDSSVTNQSSIAFVLKYTGGSEKEYHLLFLGDASAECCLNRLEGWEKIQFDCVKLPHHGSKHSIKEDTLKSLHVDNLIFSTNGKRYGHPNWEVAETAALADNCRRMIFNYDCCAAANRLKQEYPGKKIITGIGGYYKLEL